MEVKNAEKDGFVFGLIHKLISESIIHGNDDDNENGANEEEEKGDTFDQKASKRCLL